MPKESPEQRQFEISLRFYRRIEDRISRLELDAAGDERALPTLEHPDHIRRHLRLIAVQRAEARRMRIFLDQSRTRMPRPLIEI